LTDRSEIAFACRDLARRLEGPPQSDRLKAVYLDLSMLLGRIQGALNDALRRNGPTPETLAAQASFEDLRRTVRQVGFDIRLATPAALQVGMQTALSHAQETLDHLTDQDL
jgi:hypothetical protein